MGNMSWQELEAAAAASVQPQQTQSPPPLPEPEKLKKSSSYTLEEAEVKYLLIQGIRTLKLGNRLAEYITDVTFRADSEGVVRVTLHSQCEG